MMADTKHDIPTKLLWVDLEMNGLDPQSNVILEVAAKITDFNFQELAHYEAFVFQPEAVLEQSNEWCKEHHAASGLFDNVRHAGRPEGEIEADLVKLIQQYFGDERAVLAGNSIHQDRLFIRRWWPQVEALLHYRMLDVSSWKVVMQGRFGVMFDKQEAHQALGDIQESIDELKFYLNWFANEAK